MNLTVTGIRRILTLFFISTSFCFGVSKNILDAPEQNNPIIAEEAWIEISNMDAYNPESNSRIFGILYYKIVNNKLIYKFVFNSYGGKEERIVYQTKDNNEYNASISFCKKTFFLNVPRW